MDRTAADVDEELYKLDVREARLKTKMAAVEMEMAHISDRNAELLAERARLIDELDPDKRA